MAVPDNLFVVLNWVWRHEVNNKQYCPIAHIYVCHNSITKMKVKYTRQSNSKWSIISLACYTYTALSDWTTTQVIIEQPYNSVILWYHIHTTSVIANLLYKLILLCYK